jgi:hypothetical protein
MNRKRKILYWIEPSRNPADPNCWYSTTHGWFVPQYDENGRGLKSNGSYASSQDCRTFKRAKRAGLHLASLMPHSTIYVTRFFWKKGRRYSRQFFLSPSIT